MTFIASVTCSNLRCLVRGWEVPFSVRKLYTHMALYDMRAAWCHSYCRTLNARLFGCSLYLFWSVNLGPERFCSRYLLTYGVPRWLVPLFPYWLICVKENSGWWKNAWSTSVVVVIHPASWHHFSEKRVLVPVVSYYLSISVRQNWPII